MPASKHITPSVQAKPGKKKTYEDKDNAVRIEDEALDDPIAEKLRRQRFHQVSACTMCFSFYIYLQMAHTLLVQAG